MKILLIGSKAPWAIENYYASGLLKLDNEVSHFDLQNGKYLNANNGMFNRVINKILNKILNIYCLIKIIDNVKKNNYEVIIVFKGSEISLKKLMLLRNISNKTIFINYNPDNPLSSHSKGSTNKNITSAIKFYDIYITWSKKLKEELTTYGAKNVEYLAFGFSPESHKLLPNIPEKSPPTISFIGAWDKERESVLSMLTEYNLEIYGGQWDRVKKTSPLKKYIRQGNIVEEKLSEVIRQSAVCLNLLRKQNHGAHNMRTFEIPAMGGVMLTTKSQEQEDFFPNGFSSISYASKSELCEKINTLLSNKKLRDDIRKNAISSSEEHTYDIRSKQLIDIIKKNL